MRRGIRSVPWSRPGARAGEQAELAARLKVSRQTVNAIETRRCDPGRALAFAIARLFEQPIEATFQPDSGSSTLE
jgi:putative transcriptional regulator